MFDCREIWGGNRDEEMIFMEECLRNHPFIVIDTEFPGCLKETSKNASDEERYNDMCFNVDRTKLIQLGLTLVGSDAKIGGTWEINFSDFGEIEDARNEKSIEFLKRNGLDLQKIREEGIGIKDFFTEFNLMLKRVKLKVHWITFHGSYDIAYLLKYLTRESLPVTVDKFSKAMEKHLGPVYDLKVIAGRCKGLSSRLGLQSLADELGLDDRVGTAHHAGSDSQLTARVFLKMVVICHKTRNIKESEGLVYGIISDHPKQESDTTSLPIAPLQIHHVMMTRCYVLPPPPPFRVLRRPRFVSCYMPIGGGYVMVPRV